MTQRRVSSPVPYIVAVLLLAAVCVVFACSYALVTGGRP